MKLELVAALSQMYSEPHRKYHNLAHIHYCLRQAKEAFSHAVPLGVQHAIWFHDALYDPYAAAETNERNSVGLYMNYFREHRTQPWYHEAIACIEATMFYASARELDHLADGAVSAIGREKDYYCHTEISLFPKGNYEGIRRAMNYFLDIDFSILGDNPYVYKWYSTNVRNEYYITSDAEYSVGRVAFLQELLKNPIYRTDKFKAREEQARHNIESEIYDLTHYGEL